MSHTRSRRTCAARLEPDMLHGPTTGVASHLLLVAFRPVMLRGILQLFVDKRHVHKHASACTDAMEVAAADHLLGRRTDVERWRVLARVFAAAPRSQRRERVSPAHTSCQQKG